VVVVWAAMMIRKMMIIIAAVLTPLAFSGATADITRGWVRKWIEFMAAMIASKLLLVIILMIGVSVIDGAGISAQPGPGQQLTQLATGSLILLMGGFAPWAAIKMFHFTGDALYSAHTSVAAAPSGARTVLAAPQKLNVMHSQASGGIAKLSDAGAGSSAGSHPPKESSKLLPQKPAPSGHPGGHLNPTASGQGQPVAATAKPLTTETGTSAAAGSGAAAGGSAAAAAVVAPVVAGATSVAALKKAATAAAASNGAGHAAPPPPPTSPPPTSPVQHWPRSQKPS
jgi:type IV secretion system protein TrbL